MLLPCCCFLSYPGADVPSSFASALTLTRSLARALIRTPALNLTCTFSCWRPALPLPCCCSFLFRLRLSILSHPRPPPAAGLLFFSTYTLLVLFWAEIYYQARSLPTGSLRPAFVVMNLGVYAIQVRTG